MLDGCVAVAVHAHVDVDIDVDGEPGVSGAEPPMGDGEAGGPLAKRANCAEGAAGGDEASVVHGAIS